jgi:hypothetical protein
MLEKLTFLKENIQGYVCDLKGVWGEGAGAFFAT